MTLPFSVRRQAVPKTLAQARQSHRHVSEQMKLWRCHERISKEVDSKVHESMDVHKMSQLRHLHAA